MLYKKIRSKWVKDLTLKCETLELLEENIDSNLQDIGVRKNFLNITVLAKYLKPTTDNWDLKKSLSTAYGTIK